MTINALRDMIHTVPFQPFTMRLTDGRSIQVPHPDFTAVLGIGRTVIAGSEIEDHFTRIDLSLVTQLEAGNTTPYP